MREFVYIVCIYNQYQDVVIANYGVVPILIDARIGMYNCPFLHHWLDWKI